MFLVATFVLVVTVVLMLLGIAVGRRRGASALTSRAQWTLVLTGGVAAPFFAALGVTAGSLGIGDESPGPEGVEGARVEVVGKRWWWEVRYLDAAGDVVAVTANEIHLPAGARSRVLLRSDNVIHSFWAPTVQGKTDLIPGRTNIVFMQPARPGVYAGQCAEFCGEQHSLMLFEVIADAPAEFDAWLARQARPAPAPASARGFEVFMDVGCAECHMIRGTPADGSRGPDLTHLASRRTLASAVVPNTRGNLGGWITSPQQLKPGALMPPTRLPPDDLAALLDYLEALR